MKKKNFKYQKGVILIFSLFIVSFALASVFAISAIFIPKIKATGEARKSTAALYAAESVIEWCLYMQNYEDSLGAVNAPTMANGAILGIDAPNTLVPPNCDSLPMRASGTFQGVTRSYEVSL